MVSFPQVSPPKPCIRLSFPPYALNATPISFLSILSPEKYWVRSTDHSAPHYVVFSTSQWIEPATFRLVPQCSRNSFSFLTHFSGVATLIEVTGTRVTYFFAARWNTRECLKMYFVVSRKTSFCLINFVLFCRMRVTAQYINITSTGQKPLSHIQFQPFLIRFCYLTLEWEVQRKLR